MNFRIPKIFFTVFFFSVIYCVFDMEPFGVVDDDNGGGTFPPSITPYSTADALAVYKPLMPGASPPPFPSSPPQAIEDDPIMTLPPPHQPDNIVIGEQTKRKRGRPRKYAPDSKAVTTGIRSKSRKQYLSTSDKKRGRPAGSSSKYQQASGGTAGSSNNSSEFTPHIIIVNAGEDISSKIMLLAQSSSQAVCIISANGEISSVTICRALPCGTVTYEGRFQIINLSGFYTLSESVGQYSTRGLSIVLSRSDGHILGGVVAGALIAASSVQVIVGSFIPKELKHVKQSEVEPSKYLTRTWSGESPLSRGTMSDCSGGTGSPFNLSSGVCNNNSMQQEMVPFLGNNQ